MSLNAIKLKEGKLGARKNSTGQVKPLLYSKHSLLTKPVVKKNLDRNPINVRSKSYDTNPFEAELIPYDDVYGKDMTFAYKPVTIMEEDSVVEQTPKTRDMNLDRSGLTLKTQKQISFPFTRREN